MAQALRWRLKVRRPGKFEGESVAVRYYYRLWNEGGADEEACDEDGRWYGIFRNVYNPGDRPLEHRSHLVLFETDEGFVRGHILTDHELGGIFALPAASLRQNGGWSK